MANIEKRAETMNYNDGCLTLDFGSFSMVICGGPYRRRPPSGHMYVKLAPEIKDNSRDFRVDVDIPDFGIPKNRKQLTSGMLLTAIEARDHGTRIYAGCMGGIGRTGTFLALMSCLANSSYNHYMGYALSSSAEARLVHLTGFDPVTYIRRFYKPHAIETTEQERYVYDFQFSSACRLLTAVLRFA